MNSCNNKVIRCVLCTHLCLFFRNKAAATLTITAAAAAAAAADHIILQSTGACNTYYRHCINHTCNDIHANNLIQTYMLDII